ncbi:MAG: TraR/DksA C4-type zinc finger protein [Acidobacteriota bacterium]|nr:TraR/DksA C4-type zinc finger protein [Acidobacteriota bacterium]
MTGKKKDTRESFRQRLLAMEAEVNTLLTGTTEDSKPVDLSLPIGRLSRADAIQMQIMAALNKRQLEIKLKQIEGALSAVEQGSFGSCRNCNGEIHFARLEAQPETPFCIDCQEMFEQQG